MAMQQYTIYGDSGRELRLDIEGLAGGVVVFRCPEVEGLLEYLGWPGDISSQGNASYLTGVILEDGRLFFDLHDAFGRQIRQSIEVREPEILDKFRHAIA